ncbi:hypothetical protein [Sulfitobacter sp. G21635-S1]|uniref:hypothetical protein n=1 Tax=Sulfitobacter sp. G21635-S1 TaxID=3014043 RepID=UPI0022AF5AB8|nr:hypothetical protein [Sulfitobacter sp. G21635-S1]
MQESPQALPFEQTLQQAAFIGAFPFKEFNTLRKSAAGIFGTDIGPAAASMTTVTVRSSARTTNMKISRSLQEILR